MPNAHAQPCGETRFNEKFRTEPDMFVMCLILIAMLCALVADTINITHAYIQYTLKLVEKHINNDIFEGILNICMCDVDSVSN